LSTLFPYTTLFRSEDLRLVLEPAEGLAVDDAVAIERERGSRRRRLFGAIATGVRGARRVLGEVGLFELFGVLANTKRCHGPRARKLRVGVCLCGHFA